MKTISITLSALIFSSVAFFCEASTIVNPDGSYYVSSVLALQDDIAIITDDGNIRIFSAENSKEKALLKAHSKPISCAAADYGSKYLLSVSQDGKIVFWDIESATPIKEITKSGAALRACSVSRDGSFIILGGGSAIYIWDTKTWENIAVLDKVDGDVYSAAINHAGTIAAFGGKDGKINLYSLPDAKFLKTLKSGTGVILSLDFANRAGADILFSAGYDKIARAWDISKNAPIKEFSRHSDTIRGISVAQDGKYFATASDDGGVFLWDFDSGRTEIYAAAGASPATSVALDKSLRFIAAGRGAAFEDSKYTTLWFIKDRKQWRNLFSFLNAFVVVSSIGYVDGTGNFSDYVSISENGKLYPLSQLANKYNRPERMKMNIGSSNIK